MTNLPLEEMVRLNRERTRDFPWRPAARFDDDDSKRIRWAHSCGPSLMSAPLGDRDAVFAQSDQAMKDAAFIAIMANHADSLIEAAQNSAKQAERLAGVEEERDALQAFKAYVHQRLDDAGIATHPDGPHSAAGCRVGDRLDIALSPSLQAENARLREALAAEEAAMDGIREAFIDTGTPVSPMLVTVIEIARAALKDTDNG